VEAQLCGVISDTLWVTFLSTPADFFFGENVTSCEQEVILESGIVDPQVSIQWSTGESTSAITVNKPGKYWIEVSGICGVSSDSLWVTFQSPPAYFSLGEDKTICPIGTQLLKPYLTSQGYDFVWQDGTKNDLFEVTDYGTYWVSVKNECGEVSDTISFTHKVIELDSIPNVITPNGDAYNEFFILKEVELGSVSLLVINRWGKQVYHSDAYKNDWNASDLSEGVYFYTISGNCINEVKGSISILR
jgi:gliding motility-associated-like protein